MNYGEGSKFFEGTQDDVMDGLMDDYMDCTADDFDDAAVAHYIHLISMPAAS